MNNFAPLDADSAIALDEFIKCQSLLGNVFDAHMRELGTLFAQDMEVFANVGDLMTNLSKIMFFIQENYPESVAPYELKPEPDPSIIHLDKGFM